MTRVIGLREDVQLSLALKQQIKQWLLAVNQQIKKGEPFPAKHSK